MLTAARFQLDGVQLGILTLIAVAVAAVVVLPRQRGGRLLFGSVKPAEGEDRTTFAGLKSGAPVRVPEWKGAFR
jgi:hypothetical protein